MDAVRRLSRQVAKRYEPLSQRRLLADAPFDRIDTAHYVPAFETGMAEQRAEVEALVGADEAPTFENTIEAMERTGETLNRVRRIFQGLVQADTSDARQAIRAAERAGAQQYAPELLAEAKALVETARQNVHKGEYRDAREEAEQARAKAMEARSRAEAAAAAGPGSR